MLSSNNIFWNDNNIYIRPDYINVAYCKSQQSAYFAVSIIVLGYFIRLITNHFLNQFFKKPD